MNYMRLRKKTLSIPLTVATPEGDITVEVSPHDSMRHVIERISAETGMPGLRMKWRVDATEGVKSERHVTPAVATFGAPPDADWQEPEQVEEAMGAHRRQLDDDNKPTHIPPASKRNALQEAIAGFLGNKRH